MQDDESDTKKLVVRKFKSQGEADDMRKGVLETFLMAVSAVLGQTDIKTRVNAGVMEYDLFLDALLGGGSHPELEAWLDRRKGTPPGDAGELRARRLIVLLTIALERSGLSMAGARRMAAKEAMAAEVFPGGSISTSAIAHWHERMPALTPRDEQLIATAITTAGTTAKHRICLYFIGLAHYAHNPSVVIMPARTE